MTQPVFVLGGSQTDFARNFTREGKGFVEMMGDAVHGALADARVDAAAIETIHVGNFVGELFTGQGQLGGMVSIAEPALYGVPAMRHEAACASGGIAVLSAMSELEAGRYDVALVIGVELQRNVSGADAAKYLGAAAWVGQAGQSATYLWPSMFSALAEEYERRYGLSYAHIARIAEINLGNAKQNPLAQTRGWKFTKESFTADDTANPVVEGWMRRQDCGQVTDGAAAVVLASARGAERWAEERGVSLDRVPRIQGWGHRTASLGLGEKLRRSHDAPLVFPHVKQAIDDAFRRAGIADVHGLDGIETHDCFSMSEYMAIDHFGLTAPGQSFRAIEGGVIEKTGAMPINASGGLIGLGHPVGATGVRMLVDASRQVAGTAGDMQIGGAKRIGTLNIGGSTTTAVSLVVGAGAA